MYFFLVFSITSLAKNAEILRKIRKIKYLKFNTKFATASYWVTWSPRCRYRLRKKEVRWDVCLSSQRLNKPKGKPIGENALFSEQYSDKMVCQSSVVSAEIVCVYKTVTKDEPFEEMNRFSKGNVMKNESFEMRTRYEE